MRLRFVVPVCPAPRGAPLLLPVASHRSPPELESRLTALAAAALISDRASVTPLDAREWGAASDRDDPAKGDATSH